MADVVSDVWYRHLRQAIAEGGSGNSSTVRDLEDAFAARMKARFALCVSSGTSALIAACGACGVKPGDRVGVSCLGPVMPGQAIVALGGTPVFLDCASPSSFGIGAASAARAVEDGLRAVILVPMWGYWDERPEVLAMFSKSRISVIVDAAQAPFLEMAEGLLGIADIVCMSLHSRKPLRAGEGGVCLTNSERLAKGVVALRNFGQDAVLQSGHLVADGPFGAASGFNMKMNGLGAAWCLQQMSAYEAVRDMFEGLRARARRVVHMTGIPWQEASVGSTVTRHGGYGIAGVCPTRDEALHLTEALAEQGIEVDTRRFNYAPMYAAPCFRELGAHCPVAEELARRAVACRLETFRQSSAD